MIILQWMWNGRAWTGLIRLRIGQVAISCGHGTKTSTAIKYEEFIY
jgi:hypothetical protein